MAPFYDRDARALTTLLDRFRPARLQLYLGARTSVHGPALAAVVSGFDGQVSLLELDPLEFVHAKQVGIVARDRSRVLVGSATAWRNWSVTASASQAYSRRWRSTVLVLQVLLDIMPTAGYAACT